MVANNADDDVPLAALAAKGPVRTLTKMDDDTPLAALASASNVKPQKPAAKRASVGGNKPKPKAANKRRASSSSSSTSDSSSSSSSGPRKKKAIAQRKNAVKRTQTEENMEEDDQKVSKKKRTLKEEIVAQLLCRWWYSQTYQVCDWPPQEESWYQQELKKNNMRKVTVQEWEWTPEEVDGCKKVYELSQFRGLFRDSEGKLIDMRPKETCPCLNNFMKKDLTVLCDMLVSAYQNQLKELLAVGKYDVQKTADSIKSQITWAQGIQAKARNNAALNSDRPRLPIQK